jgi:hypothetical protein
MRANHTTEPTSHLEQSSLNVLLPYLTPGELALDLLLLWLCSDGLNLFLCDHVFCSQTARRAYGVRSQTTRRAYITTL